eukprot:TRINITY_DN11340_c0_g1_i4.p1 TRINITY_DN11340_c0_g1~~TRINITY_DN11340_c0_g1_i4.p1  ORF type:complete len:204 (+),score=21.16 TRINITY_DN11340_c0_g1_i4:112-723(+)
MAPQRTRKPYANKQDTIAVRKTIISKSLIPATKKGTRGVKRNIDNPQRAFALFVPDRVKYKSAVLDKVHARCDKLLQRNSERTSPMFTCKIYATLYPFYMEQLRQGAIVDSDGRALQEGCAILFVGRADTLPLGYVVCDESSIDQRIDQLRSELPEDQQYYLCTPVSFSTKLPEVKWSNKRQCRDVFFLRDNCSVTVIPGSVM